MIRPLLELASEPVSAVLERLEIRPDDVDEVVMVGGTTRMPQVRDMVREVMGKGRLNVEIDPDLTVAWGCASIID